MKHFKFLKIKRDDSPKEHWVVCVDTTERLLKYLEILAKRHTEEYILAKAELAVRPSNPHFGCDGKSFDDGRFQYAMVMTLMNHPERKTAFDDIILIQDVFSESYVKVFTKYGTLYINPVGGFYPAVAIPHTVLQTFESDTFSFPTDGDLESENVRIFQWPNGTHFYAKIGVEDIVDSQGNQHWNTGMKLKKLYENIWIENIRQDENWMVLYETASMHDIDIRNLR